MVTVASEIFSVFLQRHFLIRGAPGATREGRGGQSVPQANARSATGRTSMALGAHIDVWRLRGGCSSTHSTPPGCAPDCYII